MWPEGSHSITQTTKRPQTAGTLFKNSMSSLMKLLAVKEPFYIRCIKPNELKSPNQFNEQRVIHQVSYLGLLENVRVRRAGFAFRQEYGYVSAISQIASNKTCCKLLTIFMEMVFRRLATAKQRLILIYRP